MDLFENPNTPLITNKPIRLIELFAGIGSQAKALKRLGVNFEHYRICEFDKFAVASYNAIHETDFKVSDITKLSADDLSIIETNKYCYIMTYSFPCQDLSLAGKGNGMAKGSGTRSGLLWEVERLLNECTELPQILLMENVTQVHGKKNKEHFDEWIAFLESKGYSNYWQDLNAKNFGIPQNRNRTFMVSVQGNYKYEFPKEFPLELRLKDMLEPEVDEKFYISNEQMKKIVNWKAQQKPFERVLGRESISQTLTARGAGENHSGMIVYSPENENTTNMQSQIKEMALVTELKVIGGIGEKNFGNMREMKPRTDGVTNTITTLLKDNYVAEPCINVVGNYSPSGHDASRIVDVGGLAPTVKENHGTVTAIAEPQSCLIQPKDRNYKANNQPRETHVEMKDDGVSHALRTNAQTLVSEPIVCEQRYDEGLRFFKNGLVGTLRTIDACGDKRVIEPQIIKEEPHTVRIRKLTPKECWRLMGFDDVDFDKASKVNSNSQLYKQAGNSIVVNVLEEIFKQML